VVLSGPSAQDATGIITYTVAPTTTAYVIGVTTPSGYTPSPGNTGTLTVTAPLTSNTTFGPLEFGYFQAGTVTGTVRFDRDGDNVLFADNEPGMQGVTVTLRLGGSDVLTTTTDATGAYTFTNVPPANNYSVRVINPDPTNFLLVTPAAGDNDLQTPVGDDADTAAFNVAPGATVGGSSDAAVRGRATVTGQVWEDLNGNGQRDAGETVGALPNVPVTLTVTVNLPGLLSTTITTNTVTSGGFYTFTALPGWANASNEVSFTLGFATPSGWFATLPDVGAPATDSDGSGTGVDQLDNQPLQRNTTETRDRGYYRPAVIQVRVFEENPPVDNIYAAGDAPLTATITLTPNVVLSGPSAQDATGIITYTVAPTTTAYVIGVTTPSGYTPSPGNTGTLTVTAPLTSNTTFGPLEFGYFQAGTVTGAVRFDRDGDNVLFADTEPGMQGVTVTLRLGGSDVLTTTTDATGAYTFTGVLPANGYQVRVINPDSTNFLLVTPAGGDNDLQTPVGDDADTAAFNVAPGATVSGLSDAAVRGRATVTGQVWEDLNGNGQRDAGEGVGALPGVPVTLTVTVNLPGLLSTTITTNTVTSGGFYTFTALPGWANASNEVSFTLGFATPSGWFATLPDVGAPATDSDGSGTGVDQLDNQPLQRNTTETRDRGYYRPAVIQVRVFEENPPVDNIYAAGDAPLTATITLTPNVVLSGPSAQDATGIITYTVAPTTTAYVIGVTTPSGYTPSPGNTGTLTVTAPLTSNTTFGPLEFGYFQAGTVTGAVRFDRDGDNDLFADTEPGMQGVTVTLRLGGSDVLTTTTDATGAYTFTTVTPANNYSVRVINPDPTNFLLVTPAGGDNDMATTDIGNTYAETAAFSVTSGATVGGLSDAAVRGRATVTGQVWEDLDGDGVRDAGETVGALPGVTVNLTVTVNLPGRLSTTITANTTTNASGVYTFTALPGGISAAEAAFTLRFATPSGWFDTLTDVGTQPASDDSDGIGAGVDQLDDQALGRGATETRDRGYYRPAVIQVRVFEENPPIDNVYAAGDVPLSATITLTPNVVLSGPSAQDATGIITYTVAPTTTDYVIGVMTPSGYSPSPGNTGTVTVTAPLTSNTTYGPLAFGYFRPGTVTGTVRFDRDGDNILFADNEPGMQGVTVTLRLGGSDVLTTTTDATGAYTFTTVTPANNYSVRVINPDPTNFLLVTPAGGDNDMAATDGGNTYAETAPFTVTSGAAISRTAAVRGRATVTGQVWEDLNGNGQRDAGETVGALPEVTVNLTVTVNLPGLLSTTITTNTTTNASGFYTFTALPGWANASTEVSFTLGFATPSGWFETPADVGAQATDSDGIGTGVDQLNDQELQRNTTETRDRGYYRPAVIQVRVFEETTSPINNVYASGDAPITGATVTLTPNVTLGGPFGPDATGIISYTVTPTTTAYTVGVTAPAAYFPSPGNTGTATAPAPLIISGQTITPLPFGYYRNGVISGTVWFDANVNGTFNTGEPTMAGVTVTLHLDPDATVNGNEALIGTFTTGDNGIYQFTNITPTDVLTTGTLYRVRFELPTGYVFTTQGALTTDNNSDANTTNGYTDRFSVGSNETVTYVDAGAVGNLSLSGTAWEDTDADGTFDAGETGLPGVTLTLTVTTSINSTNPTVVYTVTTGAGSPNFTFNQLPAGNYQLSVTAKPLGYLLSTTGTLSGTLPATGQNFGLYRTAAVGDRVWLDVNGNGTYDTGVDAGLPGVTVRLRDASTDVVISTTTTLASGDVGFYGFENVTPGSYVVEFVVPSGFQTVNNGAGSLSVDNDNDAQSNGRTAPFVLASNQISTTVDAGLIGDGSISGIAWIDENFDDIRNPGETQRVSGVQVTLTITPTALSSSLTLSTTTNASGVYTFTNLPPGTFVLTFTRPAGYFDITPRVGSDPTVDSDAPVATGTLGAGQSITTLDAGYRTQMRVFLPLIMAPMTPPDLVVEAFTVTPAKSSYAAGEPVLITVKVKNVGGSPTTVGFWVDLYINPSTPPTTPNVRWNDVCGISPCYGIAWYVNQSLAPGQSITLTSAPGQFAGPQSIWPGSFASGTNALYVYVDSYNPPVPTGAVVESNETNNRAQITGFVVAGASFSNGADPGAPSGAPDAPIALPPRELPGPVEP
jgi:phage terminase large subunit-like protein